MVKIFRHLVLRCRSVPFVIMSSLVQFISIDLWKFENGTLTMSLAELVGTATLLFIGCMGCIGTMGIEPPSAMQMSFTFGLTVNFLIMSYGHVSGAHLNPAVTLGAVLIGLKSISTGIAYIIAQLIGATIGYGLIKIVTPHHLMRHASTDSTTPLCVVAIHPGISIGQAILVEVLCTMILVVGVCACWDPRSGQSSATAALGFGMAVAGLSLAAAPYTGCGMNPARSFGPAFWNGTWDNQWVYVVGPITGAVIGSLLYKLIFSKKEDSELVET